MNATSTLPCTLETAYIFCDFTSVFLKIYSTIKEMKKFRISYLLIKLFYMYINSFTCVIFRIIAGVHSVFSFLA